MNDKKAKYLRQLTKSIIKKESDFKQVYKILKDMERTGGARLARLKLKSHKPVELPKAVLDGQHGFNN